MKIGFRGGGAPMRTIVLTTLSHPGRGLYVPGAARPGR